MMQHFYVETEQVYEVWSVTINNPDKKFFTINFVDADGGVWSSTNIEASGEAADFKSAMIIYWNAIIGCDIDVIRTLYDVDALVT